ncbi:hypothetical protein AB0M05_41270 [Streptomyces violaceusniger]|uniref:hypothetical protein n=1 Tax=Streptomyces violaceusniger TaxID=68280 RepID=UPI00341DF6BA
MSQTHTQRLRAEQERRREAKEREKREEELAAAAEQRDGDPPERNNSEGQRVALPGQPSAPQRPQPFTADLLPSTEAVDASGELSAEERDELDRCERAFANADQAQWMRGLALHAVRDRKLHREGDRTWAEYCEEIGLSESDANRMIQEYPLARAVAQIWVTPKMVPASHVRALLPLVPQFDLEQIAQGYVDLRMWAQENRIRVTATHLTAMVERSTSDSPLPVVEFAARIKALESGIPDQAGAPAGETTTNTHTASATDAAATSHPNLGDSSADSDSPGDSPPRDESSGSHASDPEVVDAEIVDDEAARAVNEALASLSHGIRNKLNGASPDTLKAIAANTAEILNAAQDALADR